MEEKEVQMEVIDDTEVKIECKHYTKQEVRDNLKNNPKEFIEEINEIFSNIKGSISKTFDKIYQKDIGFSYGFLNGEANKVGYFYDRDKRQYVYSENTEIVKNDTEEREDKYKMETFDTTFGIGKKKEFYDSKFQVRIKTSTLNKLKTIEANSNLKPAEFYENVFQYFISAYEELHGEIESNEIEEIEKEEE